MVLHLQGWNHLAKNEQKATDQEHPREVHRGQESRSGGLDVLQVPKRALDPARDGRAHSASRLS